jgi:ATP-GRASP peptide maturase of grasp-with-spasm system
MGITTILSKELEQSTIDIIDWLLYKNKKFRRLNGSDLYTQNKGFVRIDDTGLNIQKVVAESFNSVWYRRWSLYNSFKKQNKDDIFRKDIQKEFNGLSSFVFGEYENKFRVTNYGQTTISKLNFLKEAQKVGLSIPKTIITNDKKQVKSFLTECGRIITKPISEVSFFAYEGASYTGYTTEVTREILDKFDFSMTLFQEYLDKEFEVRSFYLKGEIYSMAIFSQLDTQTTTDFRQYNHHKPNRNVVFSNPQEIDEKIRLLMKILDLETGSLDFVKTKDGRFVVLEVNPIGQFGMVSYPCNYYLEEKIAITIST